MKARLFKVINDDSRYGIGEEVPLNVTDPEKFVRLKFNNGCIFDFHPSKIEEIQTIDVTPTWSGLLPALIELANSDKAEARKAARSELQRMAGAADKGNKIVAEYNKLVADFNEMEKKTMGFIEFLINNISRDPFYDERIDKVHEIQKLIKDYHDAKAKETTASH